MQAFIRNARRTKCLCAFLALALSTAPGQSAGNTTPIGNARMARLYAADDRGPVPPSMPLLNLQIELRLSPARRAALERFVADQQSPGSPDYHHWLTPEQFADRFSAAPADAARVADWLRSEGMEDVRIARGRLAVSFSGTAASVERALHTGMDTFQVHGRTHFANIAAPSVPADLAGIIAAIHGLHDFTPASQLVHSAASQYALGGGVNALGPADLAAIYNMGSLYGEGITGSGIAVAVLGQTPIGLDDYRAYRQMFGMPANDFQIVEAPSSGGGTNATADLEEATLDVELAGAVAQDASILYVWGSSVEVAALYVIDNKLAQVMSLSYAGCETAGDAFYQVLALQAAAEGITWVSAAGDSGAAGCDATGELAASNGPAVMVPASAPSITAVGGTAFADGSSSEYWSAASDGQDGTALSYIPETGWSSTSEVEAGGGGVSSVFSKPGYQMNILPAINTGRMVPDLSFAAAPEPVGYLMVYSGGTLLVGGTSAATPVFAGITALLNQYLLAHSNIAAPGLGGINPVLYQLAEKGSGIFHDVTAGSNNVPCDAGSPGCAAGVLGYPAQTGYDLATGLGSVDAYALAAQWNSATFEPSATALSASTLQIQAEQSVTLTASVTANGAPLSGTPVEFSYVNPQAQYSQDMLGSAVTDATGTATLTLNIFPAGANTITAAASGTATVAASPSSNAVTIAVSPLPTVVSLTPSGGPYRAGQTVSFNVQVSSPENTTLSGPDPLDSHFFPGSVSLYSSADALLGTAQLSGSGAAVLTTNALVEGGNAFYASYSGNDYAAPSQSAVVSITAAAQPGTSTTTTLSTSSAQVVLGSTITLSASVVPATGATVPSGSVTFFSGAASLATVTLDAYGTAAYTFVPVPTGSLAFTGVYSGSNTFDSSTSAPLEVNVSQPVADFSLTGPSAIVLTAGSSTSALLSITPLNGFAGAIQLSCAGLPAGISCNMPQAVSPSGTTAVTVTIAAAGATLAAGLPFAFLLLLIPCSGRRMRRFASLAAAAACFALFGGCGSMVNSSSQATALLSKVCTATITATSGSITHQLVISVTVNP